MIGNYTLWYHILEEVFGNRLPHKSNQEIQGYVSRNDWMIIPLFGETDKNKAKEAERPNLYISLRTEGSIGFGIAYDKIACVNKLRDIILPFNEGERNELLKKLAVLDDTVFTYVNKKIRHYHRLETPEYEVVFEQKSNEINLDSLVQAFRKVDKIMEARKCLDRKDIYQLAPSIDLLSGTIEADERHFRETMIKIRPVYEMTINLRTEVDYSVCNGCLCFTCEEKGSHDLCKCPCPGFPKHVGKKVFCSSRNVSSS